MERTRQWSGVADIASAVARVVGISSLILLVLKGFRQMPLSRKISCAGPGCSGAQATVSAVLTGSVFGLNDGRVAS